MINILTKKAKKNITHEYYTRVVIVIFMMSSLLFSASVFLMSPAYFYSVKKEEIAEKSLSNFNLQNPGSNLSELNGEILKNNEKLTFLLSKTPSYILSEDLIEKIIGLRTPGVSLNSISYVSSKNSHVVSLSGVASDRVALRVFKESLETNESFATVDLPISNFVKPTNIDFSLTINLK
jgi:hypothetical protein